MLPEKIELVREWLSLARDDLLIVDRALHVSPPLPEPAFFHCQQAAEKALKGYLAWHDQPFRKTHDLQELLAQCMVIDPDFGTLDQASSVLTRYAVDTRYPRHPRRLAPARAEDAAQLAREILNFVLDRLPPEVRP